MVSAGGGGRPGCFVADGLGHGGFPKDYRRAARKASLLDSGAMAIRVVIVGGGLMGLSAAFHLRRADPGTRVTVLERARVGAAASGASAAGVRAMGRDPAERALALASLARWPGLDRELEAPTGYRRTGGCGSRSTRPRGARRGPGWRSSAPTGCRWSSWTRRARGRSRPGSRRAAGAGCTRRSTARPRRCPRRRPSRTRRGGCGARVEEGAGVRGARGGARAAWSGVERGDGAREACDVAIVAAGAWSATLLARDRRARCRSRRARSRCCSPRRARPRSGRCWAPSTAG